MSIALFVIATIWNSLVAWAFIGIIHLMLGLGGAGWDWHSEYLLIWGFILVYGYLKIWDEETR